MYLCFLAGGAVLPLISVLFGFLSDGADADIDTGVNMDAGVHSGTEFTVGTDMEADIGSAADAGTGVDTDFNADTGSVFSIGILPSSLMAISALAIAFGTIGGIMTASGRGKIITLVGAILGGYLASVVVQTIVNTLKRIQLRNYGVNESELLLYDGKVVETILPGQLGTVSFVTLQNILVSYPAKCLDGSRKLEAGKIVKVKEIINGVVIVEPKNKYE
jgi:hypothetical protein